MVIVGSVTPWISGSFLGIDISVAVSGWDKDGKITLFLAIIAGGFFLVGLIGKARWPFVVSLVITIITGAVFAVDTADILNNLSSSNIGYGLYIGLAGVIIGLIAAIGGIAARRE